MNTTIVTEDQIATFLSKQEGYLSAREIARGIVGRTGNAKHVNPALYKMLAKDAVTKIDSSPPRWMFVHGVPQPTKRERPVAPELSEEDQQRQAIMDSLTSLMREMSVEQLESIRDKLKEGK